MCHKKRFVVPFFRVAKSRESRQCDKDSNGGQVSCKEIKLYWCLAEMLINFVKVSDRKRRLLSN